MPLIVSMWKSAPFWPMVCPDGHHLASFIREWWSTTFYTGLFVPGISGKDFRETMNTDTVVLALFIDFSVQPRGTSITDICLWFINLIVFGNACCAKPGINRG